MRVKVLLNISLRFVMLAEIVQRQKAGSILKEKYYVIHYRLVQLKRYLLQHELGYQCFDLRCNPGGRGAGARTFEQFVRAYPAVAANEYGTWSDLLSTRFDLLENLCTARAVSVCWATRRKRKSAMYMTCVRQRANRTYLH